MGSKIKIDGKEHDTDQLSEVGLTSLSLLTFVDAHVQEMTNNLALFQRAKQSYLSSLKNEIISGKAGFLFDDN